MYGENLVDLVGIEPTTSSMPWKRAPSCATGPLFGDTTLLGAGDLNYSRRLGKDSQRGSCETESVCQGLMQRPSSFARPDNRGRLSPHSFFISFVSSTGVFCHN